MPLTSSTCIIPNLLQYFNLIPFSVRVTKSLERTAGTQIKLVKCVVQGGKIARQAAPPSSRKNKAGRSLVGNMKNRHQFCIISNSGRQVTKAHCMHLSDNPYASALFILSSRTVGQTAPGRSCYHGSARRTSIGTGSAAGPSPRNPCGHPEWTWPAANRSGCWWGHSG